MRADQENVTAHPVRVHQPQQDHHGIGATVGRGDDAGEGRVQSSGGGHRRSIADARRAIGRVMSLAVSADVLLCFCDASLTLIVVYEGMFTVRIDLYHAHTVLQSS